MKMVRKVGSIIMISILMVMLMMPSIAEAQTDIKEICIGWTVQLSVNTKKSITWSSTNTKIATVSKSGLVTGKGVGSVFIFAKYGKENKSWLFSVVPAEEEVVYYKDISKPVGLVASKSMYVGDAYTLKLNGVSGTAKWDSNNKSVATVSNKGTVTAKKKGTATISATVNKKKYTCKITVIEKTAAPTINLRIVQNGKEIKVNKQDEEIRLDRKDFFLRVNMPLDGGAQISALDNQIDYNLANGGMKSDDVLYLSFGTSMAASGQYEAMIVDNEANHYICYSADPNDSRVTMISKDKNNIIDGEWQIKGMEIRDTSNYELTEYSFKDFPLKKIYLVVFVDFDNDTVIDSGEYSKLVLTFND
ncbi:MAG: Ig-like domain-containing protein [Ruminiclostridium sp.]